MFSHKNNEPLIPRHGGFRKLKSFQIAQLVYDVTVRFCNRYISKYSRTYDQMIQAARSGVQNIAEGSLASGTSKKTELKLTNVARASLGELRLDYEDFLRQRNLPEWEKHDPRRDDLVAQRPKTADDVAGWVQAQKCGPSGLHGHCGQNTVSTASTESTVSTKSTGYAELSANAALVLIDVASELLNRQLKTLAKNFMKDGGFTERLHWFRSQTR